MKRFVASTGAILLATAMLASCSAYNNPEKYITVPELSSITLSQSELSTSLQEQIDEIRENSRKEDFKEVAEASQLGDQVNIDFEGRAADSTVTISENTLKGMKAEKQDVILGSGSMIGEYTDKGGDVLTKGFEEQIIGMKADETKDITVTFPDDYDTAELQGVKVIFTITVHTVSRLTVDENCLVKVEYTFTEPDASSASSSVDDSLEDDEEDALDFSDLFDDGDFEIDYTAEADDEETFNEIFKIADVRDLFKGMNKYGEVEHTLTVPSDIDKEDFKAYAGKEITATFTVDSATILPEWNDELANEYSQETYTTAAAYEEALMKDLKSNAAYEAVMAAVVVNEYPESETEKLYKEYVNQLLEQQIGSSLDEMSQSELNEKIDAATYQSIRDSAANQALLTVKETLVLEYLFDKLDITLTDKEYEEKLKSTYEDYAANYMYYYYYYYGVMFSSAEDMESYYGKEEMERQIKTNMLLEVLPENVTIGE